MVFDKIKEIIVDQLGVDESEITMNTTFEDLGCDSLDLFQIIIEIEEAFNVQIENPEKIKNLAEAVEYVEKNNK